MAKPLLSLEEIIQIYDWDGPMEVNGVNSKGDTLLILALERKLYPREKIKAMEKSIAVGQISMEDKLQAWADFKQMREELDYVAFSLLEIGANPNCKGSTGWVPLDLAIHSLPMVQKLFEKGADVNFRPSSFNDLCKQIARSLVFKNSDHHTGSMFSLMEIENDLVEMGHVFLDHGAKFEFLYEYIRAELIKDCVRSNMPIPLLKRFEEAGLGIFKADESVDESMLASAISFAKTDIVQFLVEGGADTSHVNHNHFSIAHLIASVNLNREGSKEEVPKMFEFLKDKQLNWNVEDKQGKTPLFYALISGKDDEPYPIVQEIVDNGADPHYRNKNGKTALLLLIEESKSRAPQYLKPCRDSLQFLIKQGVDTNVQDKKGNTALHQVNDLDMFKMLLDAGADYTLVNQEGLSVENIDRNNPEFSEYLRKFISKREKQELEQKMESRPKTPTIRI